MSGGPDLRDFETRCQVRWGDMDSMAHLNNTVYLRFMEEARLCWFRACGMLDPAAPTGPILARVECDFRKPVVWPADIVVRQRITRVGRSSVDHELELFLDRPDGELVAEGKSVLVWMNYASGKSEPWPDAIRALISV